MHPGIRVLRCEPTLVEGMERIAHHIYGERGELDRVDPVSRQRHPADLCRHISVYGGQGSKQRGGAGEHGQGERG